MPDIVPDLASLLLLGFFLGMRHATDADHVVAVSTIISRQRGLSGSALIGAVWGLGHTLTILATGSAIIIGGVTIPTRLELALEAGVGLMLILLGLLSLTGLRLLGGNPVLASSGASDYGLPHSGGRDIGQHAHTSPGSWQSEPWPSARWLRPFVVGIVHGLAGSAGVALLVLAMVANLSQAVAYLLLFGAGTSIGMMLITLMLAAPFAWSAARLPWLHGWLRHASGVLSLAFGLLLVYECVLRLTGLSSAASSIVVH